MNSDDVEKLVDRLKEFYGHKSVDLSTHYSGQQIILRGSKENNNAAILIINLSSRGSLHLQSLSLAIPLMGVLREFGVSVDATSITVHET